MDDWKLLEDCTLCPRNCHVNRLAGQQGYCRQTWAPMVARAALHPWEEPCLCGERGSGTVFFSGCSLGCVYCQNWDISRGERGRAITVERLAEIFLELQAQGAANINLVTGDHHVVPICQGLRLAKERGLTLPVVFNCGGYAKASTLAMLRGLVDIYLPDFKYWSPQLAGRYSNAPDYRRWAQRALEEMVRQVGPCQFEGDQLIRGVLVRHLVLPGCVADSKKVLYFLHHTYGSQIYISIMSQYTPLPWVQGYPELDRHLTPAEYDQVVQFALYQGIENGFVQEGEAASESFIPPFDETGVLPQ